MDGLFLVFAKAPVAGQVKTRLARVIGDDAALALAWAFLHDTLARVATVGEVVLASTGPAPGLGVPVWQQGEGELGARMGRLARRALADRPWVILLGADSPGMDLALLRAAVDALAAGRAPLAPADDGGFVLLGLRRGDDPDALFAGIPWSTAETGAAMRAALDREAVPCAMLPPWFDVDEPGDLERLRALDPASIPHTRAVLDRLGARMSVTLYTDRLRQSPYVLSAWLALAEKGVAFEDVPLDLAAGDTKTADFLAKTGTARVPALVHDDFGLAESTAIIEYVDEVFPGPRLLPADPQDRARVRQLLAWIRSDDTLPVRRERPTSSFFGARVTEALSEEAARAAAKLVAVAERALGDRDTVGAEWSIADADLAICLYRLRVNGDPLPERLGAWVDAQIARPAVQRWLALPRP